MMAATMPKQEEEGNVPALYTCFCGRSRARLDFQSTLQPQTSFWDNGNFGCLATQKPALITPQGQPTNLGNRTPQKRAENGVQ